MIEEYVADYSANSAPMLCKQLTQDGQVLMRVSLTPNNLEELVNVSDETIYQHINNLIDYMKTLSQGLSITPSGNNPRDGWAVIGWSELSRINSLTSEWWNYVEFRDSPGSTFITF